LPIAVHRTILALDGGGKAPVNPAKMMLRPCLIYWTVDNLGGDDLIRIDDEFQTP
jgi:hypothetical protein